MAPIPVASDSGPAGNLEHQSSTPTAYTTTLYDALNRPIYQRTAAYGHFGRAPDKDGGFSWERTDLADALKRAFR